MDPRRQGGLIPGSSFLKANRAGAGYLARESVASSKAVGVTTILRTTGQRRQIVTAERDLTWARNNPARNADTFFVRNRAGEIVRDGKIDGKKEDLT